MLLKNFLSFYILNELSYALSIPCSALVMNNFAQVNMEGLEGVFRTVSCVTDINDINHAVNTYSGWIDFAGLLYGISYFSDSNIAVCPIGCGGCFSNTLGDCISCYSQTRGNTPNYPTPTEFGAATRFSCECRENFIELNLANCECPTGFYIKKPFVDQDYLACIKCPIIYTTCYFDLYLSNSNILPYTCATGTGRSTDIALLCACQEGYQDVVDQVDCGPSICYQPCATCVIGSGTVCESCIDPQMSLNPENGVCSCNSGFFRYVVGNDYSCLVCHSSCLTCDFSSSDRCLTCDIAILRTFSSGKCLCPQSYALGVFPSCVQCEVTCLTCIDQNSCSTCVSGSNRFIQNLGEFCICSPGFAENPGNSLCDACPIAYSQCRYVAGQIVPLICAIGFRRTTDIATLCACEFGYQVVQDQIACAPCNQPCAVCVAGSEIACTSCIDPLMDLVGTQCLCQPGQYQDTQGTNYTCSACHSSCLTCDAGNLNNCLTCDIAIQRTFSTSQCLCPQYYASEIFPECLRCDYNCLTCINQDSCATCLVGSNREVVNLGDFCTCQSGYGEDPSISECVVCHYSCLTCLDFYYSCTGCPAGSNRQLIENNCNCLLRYYDIEQVICEQCHYTCLTCSGSDELNCLTCDIARFRVKYDNVCVCEQGYGYVDLNTELCQACNPYCLTCDLISICLTCDQFLNRILSDLDQCICNYGYYQYNSLCQQCHYTCQTCANSDFDSCLSCDLDIGRISSIYLGRQSCPCTEGYFNISSKECKKCFYQCLSCFNEYSNGCITCDATRIFLNSQCLCPIQSIDDGYSIGCTVCHYSCLTCSGLYSSDCLTCYDNSLIVTTVSRIYQYSECKCPNRWYDNSINENCQECHKSCYTCFKNTQYSCISCQLADHRIPFSNSCFCQDGYLENPSSFICDKCDYRCSTCNVDITNCLTCPVGSLRNIKLQSVNLSLQTCGCTQMAPHDQQDNPVCQTCHYTCYNCSDQGEEYCTICDVYQNRFLSIDNGSYCKCLEGYYTINIPECEACSPYCKECIIAQDFCISCNPAYFRELIGRQCLCGIRINQNLSYYDVQDPQCLVCHYSCYRCDGKLYNQCIECSTDIDLRYLLDSQCECIPGYLDNGLRVCLKCYEKCLTCELLKIFCLSCPVGSLRVLNLFTQSCDCTDGYFDSVEVLCQVCHINCDNCQSRANKCLSCKDFSNRVYNYQLYTCDCQSGYYDLGNGVCGECHFSCAECYGPLDTNCTVCPNFQITFRVLKSEKCVCRDRYFDNFESQICQACAPTCFTCKESLLTCLLCQSGQFRSLTGNDCQCQVGYFDSGNIVCEQCSSNCQECLNTKNQCSKCSGNRILNVGVCICDNGYFDDGSLQCQICDSTCLTCQNSSNFCTSCNNSYFRILNINQCICKYGFLDTGLPACLACDTRCQSCQTQINQCLSCDLLQNRILIGTTCRCNDGFYENSTQTCSICDISCQTCIGQGNYCLTCYSQLNINNLNQCQCEDGTFNNSNNVCQQCYQKCKTCTTSPTNCLDCAIDKHLVLNNCYCNDGYYDSGATLCQLCSYQCATCNISQNHCVTCHLASNRTLEGSSCICQQGYYDSGSIMCFQCNTTCQTCSISSQNCTSCDYNLQRIQINNECICSPGYFHNGIQQCQICHYTCLECALQATSCTQCDIALTFRIDRSINYTKCPCQKGFYDDGTTICKQCYYNCIDCLLTAKNCIICNSNPAFERINLIPDCICQDGYFDDGIQPVCQKCNIKCQTCVNDLTNCLICESPLTRKSTPLCDCKDGSYINNNQKCSLCSIQCLTCITDSTNCLTCQPDRIQKQCLCQDGYYEADILLCQQCSPKCSKCVSDKLNCLTCKIDRVNPPNCVCKQHYYDNFINNECQECDQYCGACDLNGCIDCAANRLLSQKTCICPINSISYTDTPWCSTCSFARVTGMFSDDLSNIIYTFEKPILFNFPHKVEIQEQCQQVISNSSIQSLGQSPLCSIDNNTFIIEIGDGATIVVNDEIEFNSDLLKHQDCNLTITTIINTIINPPVNLTKPIIQVNYPKQISPCQQMQIVITNQSINGKRNLILQWLSSLNLNSIQVANQQQFQTLIIESGELPQNTIIDIQLIFTNFLNQSDSIDINFTTLSSLTPQFDFVTTKTQFISWSPIKLMVYFENKICPGGVSQVLNNEISIEFMELIEMRSANALPMKFTETLFIITDSQASISTIIPSRTLSINSNYSIIATFIDVKNNQNLKQQLNIQVIRSPLLVQIIGGTRVQNYLKKFEIKIQTRDPDLQELWNQDSEIKIQVKCFDVQTNQACVVNNMTLKLNSSYFQEIAPRMFNPFNVIILSVFASKGSLNSSDQVTIIFLDADLPILNVTYPSGYGLREVNVNEKLQFLAPQQNKNISYSYSLIYNYEIVFIKNVNSEYIKFAIWDNINKFCSINKITVRILAHDIQFLMPRVCSITLNVNMPPINSIISIFPQFGNSFFTNYGIQVTKSRDKDQPIQYRFAYYQSQLLFDNDIRGGLNNLIILQDFSTIQQYSGFFESGDLILLVSVADSLGSIVNYTNKITSLDFYEQQLQLSNSSVCLEFVSSIDKKLYKQEELMVLTQEFIKLYEKNISAVCKQQVGAILMKYKGNLFEFLLQSSNVIMMSRLSSILSSLYQLQLNPGRILNEINITNDICYNTTSKFLQIGEWSGLEYLNDSISQINNMKILSIQIEKSIQQHTKLIQYQTSMLDIGDDQTERNIEQNIVQRKMFIKLLEGLYSQVYSQRPIIRNLLNNILNSLQINIDIDEQGIKIKQSNVGVQINKISQKRYDKFIIADQIDPDFEDLSNYSITRFVQISKYPSNFNLENQTFLLEKKETTKFLYIKSMTLFDISLFDPFIYVLQGNNIIRVEQIFQGRLNYNFDKSFNICDQNSPQQQENSNFTIICSNYRKEKWNNECLTSQSLDKYGNVIFSCLCKYVNPITLMILNITNITKTDDNKEIYIEIADLINFNIPNYLIGIIIISIFLSLPITAKFLRQYRVNLNQVKQNHDIFKQQYPLPLTQQPHMQTRLFTKNLKYLHQLTRIFFIEYIHLTTFEQILLLIFTINSIFALFQLYSALVNLYIAIILTLASSIIIEIIVKILEGFFTGPKALKIIGYIILVSINLGMLFVSVTAQSQNIYRNIVISIWMMVLIMGPIETLIQYIRLNLAFTVFKELELHPLDPLLNFGYYFIQDEVLIFIIDGASIIQLI